MIKEVARLLRKCKSILFITGAGISADSGLPTYRGMGGLYEKDATEDGIPIETALSGETLRQKPEITWKYLFQIEARCREAKYNRAHEILAEMERHFDRVWILTQNIDGFHRAAGSKNVIDIHGDMHVLRCVSCGWRKRIAHYGGLAVPPRCMVCGAVARPDVVFFGEFLPPLKVEAMERELGKAFDIYFSIGTTAVFPYIRYPMMTATYQGKPTVEINPSATEISGQVDFKIPCSAVVALETLWKEYHSWSRP